MDKELVWTEYPHHNAPFLFDARGHRRTGSLFMETTQDKQREPVLTLKDYDHEGLRSIYQLYMASADEYDAAIRIVGSMAHWRKLMSASWFITGNPEKNITGLESWRKDMQARDASAALKVIHERVKAGDRQASQFLLSYATKGVTAGMVQATKKEVKTANRRGIQNQGEPFNIGAAFDRASGD